MKKIFILLALLAGITMRVFSQGTTMSTAINAGSYSTSGTYTDAKNNSAGNGFVNNYGQPSNDVWYTFNVGGSTNVVNISLCGSGLDTYLHVLNSSGTEIASNDDSQLCGTASLLNLSNLAPGTYYIDAEGYGSNTGPIAISLSVTIVTPLTISYAGPQTFATGSAIAALSPTFSGGTISAVGQTSTFAGTGSAGSTNGIGTSASFNQPLGATVDPSGNIYVAEGISHLIRKITPAGVVTTFAGNGAQGFANGTGTAAIFYHPVGLASDASGNIYVADEDNNMIRKITPAGVVTTFAGSGAQGSVDGAAGSASFYFPCGVAVDGSGNVYVADAFNNKIRKITAAGVVSTLAGNGTAGTADGTGTGATFSQPFSVVTDASGNIYVTDRVGAKIRKVTPAGVVTTLAGNGTAGYQDGTTMGTTQFNAPTGLGIDKAGNLYVADEANNRIRKVTPGGVVTTLSGTGAQGSTNGAGTVSTFYLPFAITADAAGLVYTGDYTTNLIRKIVATPYTVSPALPAGLTLDSSTGVISGTPTAATAQTTYTITASNNDNTATAPLTVTITAAGALNLSFDRNYIVTYVPRIKDLTTDAQVISASSDKTNEEISVQYFDGLGRPQQSVQVKGSATGRDIVQPIAYDAYGREAIKYQPYVATAANSNGSYKGTAMTDQPSFYSPADAAIWNSPGIKTTSAPYSQTVFEQSPLNRVTEQGAPGTDWQPSGTTGHTIKTAYTTNNITAVSDTSNTYYAALYTVGTDGSLLYGINGQNNYLAGALSVTVSKDENWTNTGIGNSRGGTTEEYRDEEGHVVLKRTFNYIMGSPGTLQMLSTYYVYDDFGNLCYVLPPGSGADGGITSALNQNTLDGVCYQYKYDGRNRLVEKKVSGKGWEYIVYNQLDQVVATQDANQRGMTPLQQASFTKYDVTGRVVLTGVYNVANATVAGQNYRTNMQSDANSQPILWESRQYVGTAGTTDYTSSAYPQLDFTPLTINYYDNYTAIPGRPGNYTPASYSTQTQGLLTANRRAVLNTPTVQLLSVHWYDDKGRETNTFKQHYKLGANTVRNYDAMTMTYDFTNAVTTTTRKHYIYDPAFTDSQLKLTVWNRYLYDHMGRKVKTWEQITNADGVNNLTPDTKTLISGLIYNELGQLMNKKLHATDTTGTGNYRQTLTYAYNERGWLSSSLSDQFNMHLYYNDAATGKQFNGNIVNQVWQAAGGTAITYTYSYDQLNRLTKGLSTAGNNESNITYDPRGNILTLNRYATTAVTLIDRLTYLYPLNSNQLSSVTDDSGNALGQKTGTATYGYDLNGNLTSDNSRGIPANGIAYNLLNLPQSIASLNTTYTYDANGQKLRKVITGTGSSTTEYIGGIQYNGTAVDFIQTEEGRAIPNGATAYNYEYSLTDHLGNNRVNFDTGTGTTARQVQTDDYYPFGMESNSTTLGTKNLYLYNKKELQSNLNLYDYGARFYDPVIARWTAPDPLAEFHYEVTPHNYAMNNPVANVDIMGLDTASVKNVNNNTTAIKYDDGTIVQLAPTVTIVGQRIPKKDNSDDDNNDDTFSFDKQAEYLDKHSFPKYIKGKDKNGRSICGHCALIVRLSLEAGGLKTNDRPASTASAKNYGPYLLKKGYNTVSKDNYTPQKGDIRVWQPYQGGDPNGHIDGYDGKGWVSDFKENPLGPGQGYRDHPDYEIYRRGQ